ncbi:hypothetical protein TNCV_1124211 [Trichonephila clavipes]|uniref:Uncharacterized protein n=1 Tax=Trichonephila clavipes TaxID=2585209 RepID=A0A8X6VKR0_TRICX|nr:hypothetical protein TNCV_1124211 [Trichonephila clavipes]
MVFWGSFAFSLPTLLPYGGDWWPRDTSEFLLADASLQAGGRSGPAPVNRLMVGTMPGFCQMTGTLPPLLDSVVGGGTPERRCFRVLMDPMLLYPGKGLVLPNLNIDDIARNTRFLILSLPNNDMSKKLPFAIHKALIGIGGELKSVKR